MQFFLATLENSLYIYDDMPDDYIEYGLVSYFYIKNNYSIMDLVLKKCKHVLVDSGAFSFQQGKKSNFNDFVLSYEEFVKKYANHPRIIGFFEMDIDVIVGFEEVLKYRRRLEKITNKIIPVWHQNRGIKEFYNMCKEYSGRRISVSAVSNPDIIDSQYNLFINTAKKYNTNIHLLGMTRFDFMQSLNLTKTDSADSSSWKQTGIFGGINLISKKANVFKLSCIEGLKIDYRIMIKLNLVLANKLSKLYMSNKGEN